MIKPFSLRTYIAQLSALGFSQERVVALESTVANPLAGFEPSSRSVASLCFSHKMGIPLKVGSKLENAGRYAFELSEDIEGFYFKVGEIAFPFTDEQGKRCGVRHRPDALRLLRLTATTSGGFVSSDHIRFAEFKSWDVLEKASRKGDRYVFDASTRRFRCPSAEQAALETYGFGYDILTERDFDAIVVANMEYLHVYFNDSVPAVPAGITERARSVVALDQGISVSALLASVEGLTADRFCKLLVDQKLYVPLEACQLDLPTTVQVFTDRVTCDALGGLTAPKAPGRLVVRNRFPRFEPNEIITIRGKNHTVLISGAESVQFRTEKGDSTVITRQELEQLLKDKQISSLGVPSDNRDAAKKILLSTSPERLKAALERYAIIRPVLEGKLRPKDARLRMSNFSTWLSRAKAAAREMESALVGLLDGRHRQGRHGSHLSPAAEAQIAEVIEQVYASNRAPKKCAAYGSYRSLCKKRCVQPVSEKTFALRIRRYAADYLAKRREGAFSAAAAAAPVDHETLLMGGGRWFMHTGHMDEFVFDLSSVFPELGVPLGTAWVVVMIDSYTRTVLAVVATFEAPSYVTTMATLRECVSRWGRLPEIIFMDNGPSFKNTSLTLFAEYYSTQLCWRPPGQPRWGAEVERFIGDLNQRVGSELPGATKILNRLRRMSRSHHPDKLAIFGLQSLSQIVRDWCFNVFDTLPHKGLNGKTPAEMRALSKGEHGERLHLKISDDPLFPILSLPAPEGDGTAKVQAHDGVQIDNLYYWNKRFYEPEIVGTRVQVRYDPFNITLAYAFVMDEWVQCDCIKLLRLRRLSPEDLCAASLEIRKGRSDYNKRRNEVIERVDAFLHAAIKTGEELAHLLRTKESARQFLRLISPPKIGEDDLDTGAATAPTAPHTPPSIPGFSSNIHS